MSWPGAMMSGLSRSALARSGPRDENEAVNGAAAETIWPLAIVAVAPAVAV
jgi:hypothetical protein